MAHKIKSDLQIDTLAGAGTRGLAVDSSGTLVEQVASEQFVGSLLGTIDMTNGGANNLQNIDIIWQVAWDAFDYVDLVVSDARNGTGASQVAWALATTGAPNTWLSFASTSREAMSWTDNTIDAGDVWHGVSRMWINANQKRPMCNSMTFSIDADKDPNSGNDTVQGTTFDYSGTTLTNSGQAATWQGWNTGSKGLNGHILRLVNEAGAFNNGTIRLVGYKYPS